MNRTRGEAAAAAIFQVINLFCEERARVGRQQLSDTICMHESFAVGVVVAGVLKFNF